MTNANPEPYSERVRLREITADARRLLAQVQPVAGTADDLAIQLARRAGELEATLAMLADSAEIVASESE